MKCKEVVIAAILLVAILNTGVAFSAETTFDYLELSNSNLTEKVYKYIELDKSVYDFGETVYIKINLSISGAELLIRDSRDVYRYAKLGEAVAFLPKYVDNYTAELFDPNTNTTIDGSSFIVESKGILDLVTDKKEYVVGETVFIYPSSLDDSENYSISIVSDSSVYDLVGKFEIPLKFTPARAGDYQIVLKDLTRNSSVIYDFKVKNPEEASSKIAISTDKKVYYLGEVVNIYLNFTKKEDYILSIEAGRNIYKYLGIPNDVLSFAPKEAGDYIVNLEEGNKILASNSFFVVEKPEETVQGEIFTDKKSYYLGEVVLIYYNVNISEIKILHGNESFGLEAAEETKFKPERTGNYTIYASFIEGNKTIIREYSFYVKAKEAEYSYFELSEDAIFEIDLSEKIESKKTILNRIFGTSPIEELTAYVVNHSEDVNFNLGLDALLGNVLRIRIKSSPGIEAGVYVLIVNAKVNGDFINETRIFNWGLDLSKVEEPITEVLNATETKANLTKYVNYSFILNEEPRFEVDFTNKLNKQRTIIEAALKKTMLDEITTYVEGEEENSNFNLSIGHLEFDKFLITIKTTPDIEPDVYNLAVIAKSDGQAFREEMWFNWGLESEEEILERLGVKGKEIILQINKSVELINLSSKLINETETYISVGNESIEENITYTNLTIYTDKKQYTLDDTVYIYSNADIYELKIIHADSVFYTLEFAPRIAFVPPNEGQYFIEAKIKDSDEVLAANFSVAANIPSNLTDKLINKTQQLINLSSKLINEKEVKNRLFIKNCRNEGSKDFNLKFYKNNRQITEIFDNESYDVEIIPLNQKINKIKFNNLEINDSIDLGIDDVPITKINIENKRIVNSFAIDPTQLNFSNATVTATASGNELWKCKDWNFSEQRCYGGWQKVMDLVPGQEYSFTLTPEDPGYAETGVASINTKKSIYHPGETAEIIMVVLDTAGHLVANANVVLNITSPDNIVYSYSTSNNEITETERGIYEAGFLNTDLEGNYSMFVKATGNNVDSVMLSYFAVKEYYEFDILRQTPVTTDPWKGAFTSSIRIISYTDANIFDFSEVLPIDFEIINNGNSIITIENNKKILTWQNLANNSVVSYSALPPLVTPELYEIGPSYINYGSQTFTEARPWYLAVDPIFVSTNEAHDIDIAILDDDTGMFVIAWCDDTDDSARYQVFYTNGTAYRSLNEFDTAAGDSCRIAVTALNSTAFVIAYADWVGPGGGGGPTGSSDWTIVGYDIDDNIIRSSIGIDTGTDQYVDVGVCALNASRYASVYMDDADNDATYVVYDMATQIIGQTDLDTAADPDVLDTQLVDCAAISNNSWVFAYYDDGSDENAFAMYDAAGTETKARTTIGASSIDGEVAVTGLANGGFVIVYCDSTDDDVSFTTYDSSGNSVSGEIDVDTSITSCDSADGTKIEVSSLNTIDGRFVVIYDSENGDSVYIATYNYSGNQILVPQKLDDTDTTDKAVAVAGYDVIQKKTVCKHVTNPVIVAYNNQTGPNAVWVSYYADGSVWDGICEDAPPNVTLEYPPAGYWNDTSDPYSINFNCSITDDINATNISLYLTNNQNTSFAFNDSCNIPASDVNGSCNWTKSLANGNYTWNCLGYDSSGSLDWGDVNRSILINFTTGIPIISNILPLNNSYTKDPVSLNATTQIVAECKYSANENFIYNTSGTLFDNTNSTVHGTDLGSLGEGTYTYYIKCNSTKGVQNNDSNQGSTTFTVDNTGPAINIINPANTVRDPSPVINVSFNESVSVAWYNLNNGTNITLCTNCNSSSSHYVYLKEGPHTIYVYANDTLGNAGSNSGSFTVNFDGRYYESFTDNSSLRIINNVDRIAGKVSYNGTKNNAQSRSFSDTFPSTTLNTTNWPATNNNPTVLDPNSAGEPSSPYALELANTDAVTSKAIDTSQATSVNISWYYVQQCQTNGPEVGEMLFVYYNNSAGNWVQLWSLDGGTDTAWYFKNYTLTSNVQHSGFKVKINTTSSSGDAFDQYCVDDVKITVNIINKGNFTSEWINTTANKTYVLPVWSANNTDASNNISVEISTDGGNNWCTATNNTEVNESSCANFVNSTDLVYRVIFNANATTTIDLLEINLTWAPSGAPVISNIIPVNNSLVKDPVTLSCDTDENANCKYSTTETFDYNTSGTLFTTTGSTSHSTSLGSLGEGTYTYYIKCNNTYGKYNNDSNQGSTTFTVDNTAPNITLNYPLAIFVPGSVNFNWTVTDNFDNNLSCNLTIDGVVNQSGIISLNGTSTNYTVSNFSNGVHYWNVTCWDDPGNSNTSITVNFTVDKEPPTFSNIYLSIDDFKVNITGAVARKVNISDNLSGVNNNSIKLWFSNTYPPWKYIEGVAQPTWQYLNYALISNDGNSSYYVNFTWQDDDVYRPGTFNLDPDLVDSGTHTNYSVFKNTYLRVNFTNLYAAENTSYLIEFVAEPNAGATNSLNIYYCNNSYSIGDVRTAESCVIVKSEQLPDTAEHEDYRTVKFASDEDGKIAGIFATNDSFVVFECWACANAGKGWSIRATEDTITSSYSSTDRGDSWDIISADELDVHMHWFLYITNETTSQAILYQTEAADLAFPANIVNETQTSDPWRPDNNPPTVPIVQTPTSNQLVNGIFNITWRSSEDPEGDPFDYNVTLLFTNETIKQIINGSTTLNYALFNFSTINEGSYLVRVEACDNLDLCSLDNSDPFFVDKSSPSITLNYPVEGFNTTSSPINFNWTVIDNFDDNLTCNLTIDGVVKVANTASLNNTPTNYTVSVTDGNHNWSITCADGAANVNTSETRSFTYLIIKAILGVQTANSSYKFNKDVGLFSYITYNPGDQESGTNGAKGGVFYNPGLNTTSRTCDVDWGFDCGASVAGEPGGDGDNTFDSCLESPLGDSTFSHVEDVSVNVTIVKPGDSVLVTCTFDPGQAGDSEYIWYYNGTGDSTVQTNWELLYSGTSSGSSQESQSVTVTADNVVGKHWVRCIIDYSGESDICADGGNSHDNDDINFTVATVLNYTNDGNSSFTEYANIGASNFTKLTDIDINVEISYYNASGSISASNTNPDLEVQVYDGASYSYNYYCNLNATYGSSGNFNYNCSKKIVNQTIVAKWTNTTNRKIRLRGVYLDSENGFNDSINWTSVWVELETPSKLENYGNQNLTGRLLIEVKNSSGYVVATIYNTSKTVQYNSTLNLSNLGISWNTDNRGLGAYRIYAALLNSSGGVIQNYDKTYVNDTYDFTLDYLRITVKSPLNNSVVDATNFWANVTLSYISYPSGGWCSYSLDGDANITMQNDSGSHFYNFTAPATVGRHNITFYCNDTSGDISYASTIFNATDQTGPTINLEYPSNGADGLPNTIAFKYNVTDAVSNITNCSIYVDSVLEKTNTTVVEGMSQNFTLALPDGVHDWQVRCYDNSSNTNLGTSPTYDFTVGIDDAAPSIFLGDPQDNAKTSNNDIVFYFGVYDELSGIANCTLIISGKINKTKTSGIVESFNNNDNNITFNDVPVGQYNWSINCTDSSSNHNVGTSSTRNLTVIQDTDHPIVTLIFPANDAQLTSGSVDFKYNVTDLSSGIANCSLIINGTVNQTQNNVPEGATQTFSVTGLAEGYYLWNVTCTDDSYQVNTNISETRNFTVTILENLNVGVSADKTTYEQGTQLNETVNITTNVTDQLSNPINGSATTDVIKGNTSLQWWNASWKRRKPIFINETRGENRSDEVIQVNITGLEGYVQNCNNEIRVIMNNSVSLTEINVSVIDGDDSTWCLVRFRASILANAVNENNYYAYYNNSGASNPGYSIQGRSYNTTLFFENFESGWTTIANAAPSTDCDGGHGSFNNCNHTDPPHPNYQFAATSGGVEISGSYKLVMDEWVTWQAAKGIWYSFDSNTACDGACDDIRVTGYIAASSLDPDDFCRVWARNTIGFNYSTITQCVDGESACEFSGTTDALPSATSDYKFFNKTLLGDLSYNLSSYTAVHIGAETGLTGADDDCFFEDIKVEGLRNYTFNVTSSVGQVQELINRSQNNTGDDGIFTFNLSTGGLDTGWYSAVSFVTAIGYNNMINYTKFEIVIDQTAPTVNLAAPNNGNISVINDITFYYNVSDALSTIANCSLIINGTINQTNSTITEDTALNFTANDLANGDYTWTVNCTDDSANANTGTYTPPRTLTVAVDEEAPVVTLITPINGWNDTDGNVTFYFNITDQYTSTADCELYINGTLNQTKNDLPTNGSAQNFTVSNFADGDYNWYINCTDDSLARNSNISETRNFTVIHDLNPPAIILIYPPGPFQSTTGNVSFIFNVSDEISGIANCSLIINGTINQTNSSVNEAVTQNFTVYNIATGIYLWNITCTDNSDYNWVNASETRTLTVATDTEGPDVYLEDPVQNAQIINNDVLFKYNVTDFASGISNCSLIINGTINQTNSSIEEEKSQNFTLYLGNGDYMWQVNCTDDSANANNGSSEIRNLTIGKDEVAPVIDLEYPPDNAYNDTDGTIVFLYSVNDYASGIADCSIILDGVLNQTNASPVYENTPGQNFTISGVSNGTHTWSINCTDTSPTPNTGNGSTWTFNVHIDEVGPVINLISPGNNSIDTDGSITFYYNVTDEISGIANCSLIINERINKTNSTVTEGISQNFTLIGLANSLYNWSINCTDNSDNLNVNSSETRILNVTIDTIGPVVTLISPPNNTLDTDGVRVFSYNVTDDISNISSCSLLFNGAIQKTNTTITKAIPQNFSLINISTGQYNWSVNCTDASENLNVNSSEARNFTEIRVAGGPVINLESPNNNTQDVDNNVTFKYNVSHLVAVSNCSLIIDGTINQTNFSIALGASLNFTINNMPDGTYEWNINCTDASEDLFTNSSEIRLLIVGSDSEGPVINLEYPPGGFLSTSGSIVFKYNVTDFASGISNCSLIINGTINQTNSTVVEDESQNFTLNNLGNGDYTWSINCTDNSPNTNKANSSTRAFTVGLDLTPPDINLISPENNTRLAYTNNIIFYYNVSDVTSGISNCSLVINGVINQTNSTPIIEDTTMDFTISHMAEGDYNWSINCTDASESRNTGPSVTYNLTIKLPDVMQINISTGNTTYEQGSSVQMTANTTDNESSPLITSVIVDIIKGNATASWWNTSWGYRIPIEINSTNAARYNKLIEKKINFTDVLVNELGISGKTFDSNSIRVVEWAENASIEINSQFDNSSDYDASVNAVGEVIWIMNSTTAVNTTRHYYIYFGTTDNSKQVSNYAKPGYSFSGSGKSIDYNGSSIDASQLTISYQTESFTLQFDRGNQFKNFDYVSYAGSGGLLNITVNNSLLTNLYSTIAPFVVKADDYLYANGTSTVETGPVVTKITIPGNITTISPSDAELNYTIWFAGSEIAIRADLYAYFGSAETSPSVRYMNQWFAYLLSNNSNWENYVYKAESASKNRTHNYNNKVPSGADEFNAGAWYSEHDGIGSINVYAEIFRQGGVDKTKGVVIYDDGYDAAPESDSIGFNFNETTISAGTSYSLRVWMIFSSNQTSGRARDLGGDVSNPVNITQRIGEKWVNRSSGNTNTNGLFFNNWSSANQTTGWYSAVALANRTYYKYASGYMLFEITQDTVPPYVGLGAPEGWIDYSNVTFNFFVNDSNLVIGNCTLVLSKEKNLTNSSITNNAWNTIFLYNMQEGTYNWTVNCSDAAGNIGTASERTIYVDITKPAVNLSHPNNSVTLNYTLIDFNFTATDNMAENLSCYLTLNGEQNGAVTAANATLTNITLNLTQDTYTWNITCTDQAGNANTSETRSLIVDTGPPTITLVSPIAPNNWDSDRNITFIYLPQDSSNISNCSLIIDNVLNKTNSSINKGTNNNFTLNGIPEGQHNWTVNCTDISGQTGTADPEIFYVDLTKPTINLTAPNDGYTSSSSTVQFNFTVFDNMDTSLECNITINGAVNNTSPISAQNGTNTNYNVSGFNDGLFLWNATCWDSATNVNTSVTRNFSVAEPPTIALGNPENNYWTKDNNITFFFTPNDNSGQVANCTLILNGQPNVTNGSVDEGIENSISAYNLPDNKYNWTINCTDYAGAVGTNETGKIVYVDTTEPFIILNDPDEGGGFNTDDILFNWTAVDNLDTNLTCNLTLDGAVNVSSINTTNGTDATRWIYNLSLGTHYWNVTCWDRLNNTNASITQSFIINKPDLTLSTLDIVFNDTNPVEGNNITINATIYNNGGIAANNVLVQFFDGNPGNGVQIDGNRTIASLGSGANKTVNVTWIATLGLHEIYVIVDPDDEVTETNESNNNASNNISIPSWQIVYGSVTGDLIVASLENISVFKWNVSEAISGNIYVVDSDSSISWSNLTAIGINVSGGNTTNDFEEIDTALNTTGYFDSVNTTFTSNSMPKNTTEFIVFNSLINNTPVINSTNNTSFITGILWDSLDINDGEYNGTQDLVFVTKINQNKQGKYGIYDFEIKILSELKKYKTTDIYSVAFYVELR